MFELLLGAVLVIIVCGFLLLLTRYLSTSYKESLETLLTVNQSQVEKFYEMVKEMQIQHFATVEKVSSKHLDKIDKLLLKEPRVVYKRQQEVESASLPLNENTTAKEAIENEIEKREAPEVQITEDFKVPIIDGMKVQFEDEEQVLPININ